MNHLNFWVGNYQKKKDGHNRIEIKDSFINILEKTDKANITGPIKIWLHSNYVVAVITLLFTVYGLLYLLEKN